MSAGISLVRALVGAFSIAIVVAACGRSPTQPSTSGVITILTVSPVVGTLLIGESRTLSAFAAYSNGSGSAVTASWRTDVPAVATVGSDGVLTAVGPGAATITAAALGRMASSRVIVVPDFSGNWRFSSAVVDCRTAHPDGCTFFQNRVSLTLVLRQVSERVTGQLATDLGRADVQGAIARDGGLSLQGETEATQLGITYVQFRIESWRTTVDGDRLSGRIVLQTAEFPEWRADPQNPTRHATLEFRDESRTAALQRHGLRP